MDLAVRQILASLQTYTYDIAMCECAHSWKMWHGKRTYTLTLFKKPQNEAGNDSKMNESFSEINLQSYANFVIQIYSDDIHLAEHSQTPVRRPSSENAK